MKHRRICEFAGPLHQLRQSQLFNQGKNTLIDIACGTPCGGGHFDFAENGSFLRGIRRL